MDGGGVGGVHCVVDPGSRQPMLEGLVSRDFAELFLNKAVDPVDSEFSAGTEDVELAGQHQVGVLVLMRQSAGGPPRGSGL